jgi:hypothetical protein
MSDTTISRTLIVLPGATWRAELEAELVRLGVDAERAPISAGRVLSRICRHQGFLNCFKYDEPEDITEVGGVQRRATSRRTRARQESEDEDIASVMRSVPVAPEDKP